MRKHITFLHWTILALWLLIRALGPGNVSAEGIANYQDIMENFKNPPAQFRSAPLWVWNDDITEEQIEQQLQDFKKVGIGGVFIHPRPGLITPYLSDRWFFLCRYTVDRAREMDMQVWLYDENSYPSGFAGGHVPAQMPESYNQGQGLVFEKVETLPGELKKYYLVLKKQADEYIDISHELDDYQDVKSAYYLFEKEFYKETPWHGGFSYVDLLQAGVTEKFLDVTMTGYEAAIGDEFGKLVPGIFTDEPNIYPPDGIRWTPELFDKFQERWDYDLKTSLPALFDKMQDCERIRHNYYTVLLEMFIERWSKPWFDYCEQNNLIWTGHYWEHGWPNPEHCVDNMALYAWHQMPAIDILMNRYSEDVHAQFGNARAVKELSSVANQMGRTRTLSETYGAGGWDLRFEDMKRIGDWQYVLGVNFLNQHLSYMTITGARKRDHPQSFSYHEPWWQHYKILGDYFARLSLALSSGEQNNRILVIEPTTTAWMYFTPSESEEEYEKVGQTFQNFVNELERYQVEYDLGSENIIARHGRVNENKFQVGKRFYDLIVLPPGLENLDKKTAELLQQYLRTGGRILTFAGIPKYIDGLPSSDLADIVSAQPEQWLAARNIADEIASKVLYSREIQFHQPETIAGRLFHHRRQLADGQLVFLVNTSIDAWASGRLKIPGKSVQEMNLLSGDVEPYPSVRTGNSYEITFDLPPAGSSLLFISSKNENRAYESAAGNMTILTDLPRLDIQRMVPNVLTLDYCDLKIQGKEEKDVYCIAAADKVYRHYGFAGNPWSRAVQYQSDIIDRDVFASDSGFEATFSLHVTDNVDKTSLQAVVEQPHLWQLAVNGTIVEAMPNRSWLDRTFGVYDIARHIKSGTNELRLIASPMTVYSELEPIYILGNFHLEQQSPGWKLIKTKRLSVGSWQQQGLPYYSAAVSYSRSLPANKKNHRYIIHLTRWQGSVAEVFVNNNSAGIIAWQPYELDLTDHLSQQGENKISVVVYGTLKNLLGPHHNGIVRGTAWPASFETAPDHQPDGRVYDLIDYGLFEDFRIIEYQGTPRRVYRK